MSAGNKNKQQGTTEEKRQRDVLLDYGFNTDRLAEEGIYDKGDYVIAMPNGLDLFGESKDQAQLNIHEIVQKAEKKAPEGFISFVWWKRKKRKEGNARRTQVGKPIICMNEDNFIRLLIFAEHGMRDVNHWIGDRHGTQTQQG